MNRADLASPLIEPLLVYSVQIPGIPGIIIFALLYHLPRMAASVLTGGTTEPKVDTKGNVMDQLSNYIIVDIGANLTNKKFSRDLDQVIQRATDSGRDPPLAPSPRNSQESPRSW